MTKPRKGTNKSGSTVLNTLQFKDEEERDFTRKRKKKAKHNKPQRLEGRAMLEPAVLSGQWEEGERERAPTPMPVHPSLNRNKDTGKGLADEPRERKHRKRTKKKKAWSELRKFDEGFDEGSEARQTGN